MKRINKLTINIHDSSEETNDMYRLQILDANNNKIQFKNKNKYDFRDVLVI